MCESLRWQPRHTLLKHAFSKPVRNAEIARRAINAGQDKTGVQADRLALIERALKAVKN